MLSITGSYTQSSAGSMNIKIGGASGNQYDQVAIGGAAMLDGTLNVSLIGAFMPAVGNSFTIMNYGSLAGAFASMNLPPLSGGLNWNAQYGANSLILTVQ